MDAAIKPPGVPAMEDELALRHLHNSTLGSRSGSTLGSTLVSRSGSTLESTLGPTLGPGLRSGSTRCCEAPTPWTTDTINLKVDLEPQTHRRWSKNDKQLASEPQGSSPGFAETRGTSAWAGGPCTASEVVLGPVQLPDVRSTGSIWPQGPSGFGGRRSDCEKEVAMEHLREAVLGSRFGSKRHSRRVVIFHCEDRVTSAGASEHMGIKREDVLGARPGTPLRYLPDLRSTSRPGSGPLVAHELEWADFQLPAPGILVGGRDAYRKRNSFDEVQEGARLQECCQAGLQLNQADSEVAEGGDSPPDVLVPTHCTRHCGWEPRRHAHVRTTSLPHHHRTKEPSPPQHRHADAMPIPHQRSFTLEEVSSDSAASVAPQRARSFFETSKQRQGSSDLAASVALPRARSAQLSRIIQASARPLSAQNNPRLLSEISASGSLRLPDPALISSLPTKSSLFPSRRLSAFDRQPSKPSWSRFSMQLGTWGLLHQTRAFKTATYKGFGARMALDESSRKYYAGY